MLPCLYLYKLLISVHFLKLSYIFQVATVSLFTVWYLGQSFLSPFTGQIRQNHLPLCMEMNTQRCTLEERPIPSQRDCDQNQSSFRNHRKEVWNKTTVRGTLYFSKLWSHWALTEHSTHSPLTVSTGRIGGGSWVCKTKGERKGLFQFLSLSLTIQFYFNWQYITFPQVESVLCGTIIVRRSLCLYPDPQIFHLTFSVMRGDPTGVCSFLMKERGGTGTDLCSLVTVTGPEGAAWSCVRRGL